MTPQSDPVHASHADEPAPPSPPPPPPQGRSPVHATECDVVMKGGITSGVVYPLAIVEIARAFRLRSIGGTSAGAIAAAAAAAAELGRQRHQAGELKVDPDGFGQLGKLPDLLGSRSADGRGTRLLAFFQPAKPLAGVFNAVLAVIGIQSPLRRVSALLWALARHQWPASVTGLALGLLPLLCVAWTPFPGLVALWLLVFAVALAVGAAVWRAARLVLRALPAHRFGFCSGMPSGTGGTAEEALTVWLTDFLDGLCGQREAHPGGKPLTFGDLGAHRVDLQMMTTCLTLGRPFRLPLGNDDRVKENNSFFVREADLEALFPPRVVNWMKANERRPAGKGGSGSWDGVDFTGYLSLPEPHNLPVVVAVRMSLSFPILLSAVPLYAIDYRQKAEHRTLQPCWFTDGGVGSNFPIHFFDAPLPARPTFGLDLGVAEDPGADRVVFPANNGDARLPYWRALADTPGLGSIAGFIGAVFSVAKDWNHEALSHLPGFRDRIGLIKLTDDEGGLNLTMPPALIAALTEYGREAGQRFVIRFGDPARWPAGRQASPDPADPKMLADLRMNWENHQLIRLRLLLSSVSEMLGALGKATTLTAGTAQEYGRFFKLSAGPDSYRFSGLGQLDVDPVHGLHTSQAGLAHWTLEQLLTIGQRIATTQAGASGARMDLARGAPRPTPELKLRPRV